jgi:hypothetical protein
MEIELREERPPYVRFESVVVEDKAASISAGHYIGKEVDYALVTPPYSKDVNKFKINTWFDIIEQDARNERMPKEWVGRFKKMYEMWKQGQELPVEGTPIKGWGIISPAQQEMLIRLNIRTVEDLAAANDEGLRRIGMGSYDLKNKANGWLKQLHDKGPLTQEIASVKMENSILKASVEALTKQVETLMSQVKVNTQAVVVREYQPEPQRISASDILEEVYSEPQELPQAEKQPQEKIDIRLEYQKKFGKPPHHRMKDETILAALKG